jgi:hypothetical protein
LRRKSRSCCSSTPGPIHVVATPHEAVIPAKAGYPVRYGLSILSLASLEYWITRPSAQLRTRRVMTTEYVSAFSRHKLRPSFAEIRFPQNRGSRECRVLAAPAVSCAMNAKRCAHEHTGTAGALRHSLRNGLTAYAALSLETNSSCLHRCRLDGCSIRLDQIRHRQLGTSHGCQDHTVLPYASAPYVLRAVFAHG